MNEEIHNGVLVFGIEDLDEDHYCPECGEIFDDRWRDAGGYFYAREGGCTDYECPECVEHTISIYT